MSDFFMSDVILLDRNKIYKKSPVLKRDFFSFIEINLYKLF